MALQRQYSNDLGSKQRPIQQLLDYNVINKHVSPHYWQAEMYAGHVACWPLVSHDGYVPCALL